MHLKGRTFYAVGGTWRSLAKLHMRQRNYPLGVMHNYRIQTNEAADFAALVEHVDSEAIEDIDVVSAARRPLLAYGAIVLDEIIRRAKPREIVISAAGVREGTAVSSVCRRAERTVDPLLAASRELESALRARAGLWRRSHRLDRRLHGVERHRRNDGGARGCVTPPVSCPTSRGARIRNIAPQRAMNIVTQGPFVVDRPSRPRLSVAGDRLASRGAGRRRGPRGCAQAADDTAFRARARARRRLMRVAYLLSASMPGVLPRTRLRVCDRAATLTLPAAYADLASERVLNRLKALGKLMGVDAQIEVAP